MPRREYLRFRWGRIGDMVGRRLLGETMDHSADERPVDGAALTGRA